MRAGDIRALTLDDLHWADATLELTQSKTPTPLLLPLTEEGGAAVLDSVRSGRPTTPSRAVCLPFTSPGAPFRPTHLSHMIAYGRHLAGSTFPTAQRRGLHALRPTLATHLWQAQPPRHPMGDILGHVRVESTRLYVKAEVEALRSVARELEEVSDAET